MAVPSVVSSTKILFTTDENQSGRCIDTQNKRSIRLSSDEPPNRGTDVIYFPTLSDNRPPCAVLRGPGYTCVDNYDDETHDLQELVKAGRKAAGDAVCTPLASIYADLLRLMDDSTRSKQAGDPRLAGKKRMLFSESQGTGPCRQGSTPVSTNVISTSPRRAGKICR